MADYVAAHITIGGRVTRRIVPKLCDAICRQGVSLDWGECDFCPSSAGQLRRACRKMAGTKVLRLYSDEVAYGNFDLLQNFLIGHMLPFDRWHESKYDIPCELMAYRPFTDLRFFLTDLEGRIVARAQPLVGLVDLLQEVRRRLDAGEKRAGVQLLRHCQRLAVQHLPPAVTPLQPLKIC